MRNRNYMILEIPSKSQNEAFARVVAAAFASQLDPTIEEIADIKTAVSEAVTNSIIHGYENSEGVIVMKCSLSENEIEIEISDEGKGIEDVKQARQPLYTSKPELERSGMGFTVMETFMDEVEVYSETNKGTTVIMRKKFASLTGEQGEERNEGE
jgi:stage II sporulation protein AB (anti-sigma F factor)